ncbi:hypothetical protein K488DRAFT_42774 [Vararia minispora EC-137]|uniref:Uncharacterized protein n=1 Tax=Vararia minispora EC-137 TaxID=1314806 RepID=A0ACB8QVB1_9AGAM|nr:hypothetical protein K488DRAFT_42774 [Vararia minispora EC-137]
MSSWSAPSYPPPPRRSRSRSPYRGGGAPYAHPPAWGDYAPAPDAYRPEWDAYDRDRAYYERDRAPYDFSRRGRSRSPGPDDGNRKRRRSMSPYDRDRYDPRPRYADDYDAHSRGYGHRSPPRGGYASSRRAPPDPHTFEYPASLKQFADWFRYFYPQQAIEEDNADKAAEAEAGDGSKPRNGIKARWEKYKKEFAANQLQTMFDHHRKSPWFAEKYDPAPEFVYLRRRLRKEGWKGRMASFVLALEEGKFDPEMREPTPDPIPAPGTDEMKSEPAPKEEPKEVKMEQDQGEDSGMAPGDESMKVEDDATMDAEEDGDKPEVNGKGSGDGKNRDKVDEMSVEPEGNQIMIRTIPPDIGRMKLETNLKALPGFVHLALGDPLQKRNFYRAGWLRFRDDVDMTAVMKELNEKKIEGFKLHLVHNTSPFKNKVRYTPEVASRPDRIEKDLANVRALATLLENEYFTVRRLPERPMDAPQDWEKGVVENDILMDEVMDLEDPEPKERGSEAVERRIEKIMEELKEVGKVGVEDEREYALKKNTVSLDLYLAYLRATFHTCYYCAIVTDHIEEFQRKCIHHVRKPLTKAMVEELRATETKEREQDATEQQQDSEVKKDKEGGTQKDKALEGRDWKRNDERWVEWLDSKVALLINRDGVDPREYGGKNYEDELSKAAEAFIKQEDEGKYRCKTCQKLFKAVTFVEKHIANKHPELLKGLDDIPYFNNFALDPHHIQPLTHPPNQINNSSNQQPPPQAYGLPGPVVYPPAPNDYGRGGAPFYPPFGGHHYGPPAPYPPPPGGGYWAEPYGGFPYAPASYPPPKRLGDRIGGFAPGYDQADSLSAPASAGLPPKPATGFSEEDARGRGAPRRRGGGPLPPPPADAKEDPRAAAGKKLSYHDMDSVAEGDVELQY